MRLSTITSILTIILLPVYGALLGIDLGQEFVKSVLVAPKVPFDIILTTDTKRKDVSGLSMTKLSNSQHDMFRNFGSHALSACVRQPSSCLIHLKSLLGKSVQDAETTQYSKNHAGVKLVPSVPDRDTVSFEIDGTAYPVEEVLAMTFENIKGRAEAHWQEALPGSATQISDVA
ncbi:unnamed protein product [Ambrosiozyma monospora]|uniref:Unnamed protein product n=1 Tax=Ambrosiozyma monospora TaxID=43982 RepID=A0ACB5TLM8_AMBMO|nr:unnamed protein product [Ambrosiozyma monospora]